MRPAAALAALALLIAPAAQAQIKNGAKAQADDGVTYVKADDPEMRAAIAKGRRTLPEFFARLANPAPGDHGFVIKYDLLPGPKAEYIWADVISHSPGVTIAQLANTPLDSRFSLGEKVSVDDAEIVDWGYFSGGVMQGNYTTHALLPRYSAADAEQLRKAFNW